MNQYYSFLIVNHPTHIDLYHMGLPIGKITNGKFEPHHIVQGDDKRQVHMGDFPKSPFENYLSLDDALKSIIYLCSVSPRPENNKDEEYKKYLELKEKYGEPPRVLFDFKAYIYVPDSENQLNYSHQGSILVPQNITNPHEYIKEKINAGLYDGKMVLKLEIERGL